MAIPRKSRTSPSPSPTPASGSTGANSSPASQNTGGPAPGVLLGLSGGWLIARMFFFGGTLWLIEIIAIATMAGFAHSKGGKGQKKFAKAIIGFAILNLLFPGLNSWIKGFRESQLNPPTTEQSAGQEQITQSLTPSPNPDWRRETLPSSNKAIVIERSGTIVLPEGKKRLFFSHMGDETGDLSPVITIAGKDYSAKGAGDFLLPEEVKGKVKVNFNGWDDKSYPGGLDAYQYYKAKKPFIELVE